MIEYMTKLDWKDYKKGDVVPTDLALDFLKRYKHFSHQSILEIKETVEKQEIQDEVPVAKLQIKKPKVVKKK